MTKQRSASGLLFGMAILVGLMPLAFRFSPNGAVLLPDTPFRDLVWGAQVTFLFLLLLTKEKFSKDELIALAVLFMLVPCTFTFNERGATFLILTHYTSSLLSWAIAGILLSKLLFTYKLNKDPNI